MLVANIFTMITTKNTGKSGECLLALPLQHSSFQFFDIFEIGFAESVGNEVDLQHVIPGGF